MTSIGAVIVTFNSEAEIGPCLDALAGRVSEIVVVDNASSDGTRSEVIRRPGVALIANPSNLGFAGGANQGVRRLTTKHVLLMNPDVLLIGGVEELSRALEDPEVGAAAGKLLGSDGSPQAGFSLRSFPTPMTLAFEVLGWNRLWPGNPVNRRYRCLDLNLEQPCDAEQPAGAFLALRRDVWATLGGFDEGFWPVWFEDVDFLKRLKNFGFRARYCPRSLARHLGGRSVGKLPPESSRICWYASFLRYARKHFNRFGGIVVGCSVLVGCFLRIAAAVAGAHRSAPAQAYVRVIRFTCRWLLTGRGGEADVVREILRKQDNQQVGRDLIQAHGTK